jgi:hypothetical protein
MAELISGTQHQSPSTIPKKRAETKADKKGYHEAIDASSATISKFWYSRYREDEMKGNNSARVCMVIFGCVLWMFFTLLLLHFVSVSRPESSTISHQE